MTERLTNKLNLFKKRFVQHEIDCEESFKQIGEELEYLSLAHSQEIDALKKQTKACLWGLLLIAFGLLILFLIGGR
mgnify:CR=1 FL=1